MAEQPQHPPFNGLYTTAQARELDRLTISDFGIDGFTLMEMAASGAARRIAALQGKGRTGLYLCGKGNNGGDALAVARYLVNEEDHRTVIVLPLGEEGLSEDCKKNLMLLKKCRDAGQPITVEPYSGEININRFNYVVDGLFGTGLSGDLRDPLPGLINKINQSACTVYSMDIPTGLNGDTGKIHGCAISADITYTFGTGKRGFFLNRGKEYTGTLEVVQLPFPKHLFPEPAARLIDENLFESLQLPRRDARHKYDGGVVHIVAGSRGLTGAAVMAAKSAWSRGAGAVILYTPDGLMPVYEHHLPEMIKVSVGKTGDLFYKAAHSELILDQLQAKPGTLLIGPGIGKEEATGDLVSAILKVYDGQAIIDADALSFFDRFESASPQKKRNWTFTPHIGEARSALKGTFSDCDASRLEWAERFTGNHQISLLLKGNPLFVTQPGRSPLITGYDTGMFNRAGFGDVLAGSIAACLSITNSREEAIVSALMDGYRRYQSAGSAEPFSPEHLL